MSKSDDEDKPTIEMASDHELGEPTDGELPAKKDSEVVAEELKEAQREAYSEERFERIQERKRKLMEEAEGNSSPEEKAEPPTYEQIDDALADAHEKCVQWKADEERPDLEKAPEIWSHGDEIPEAVRELIDEILERGRVLWDDYQRLPPSSKATIQRVLRERMTQPQGWSLRSLTEHLTDALDQPGLSEGYILDIVRNETSAVLNEARERAYQERDDDRTYVFDWIGPNDHRTTDTCLAIEERIEAEGGAVTMDRLKELLLDEAQRHADAEGTPERVDDWLPHYNCRRTFVRRVQRI